MIRFALRGTAFLLAVALLLWGGIALRAAVWEWTMPIRFNGDIDNGYRWGNYASHVGFLNVYDELGRPGRDPSFQGILLDYGPLRLGVMSAWVSWVHTHYPGVQGRDPSAAFHAPLLWFNTSLEFLTTVATFCLVMLVLPKNASRMWIALAGTAVTWFNPVLIYNAHAWPQWDIWPMPFYLFAVCCGLRRKWLAAGAIIGVGAMLKGQIFMVAWTLPVWALFVGDWRGMLRFLIGAATSVLLIGVPWELSVYLPGRNGFDRWAASAPMRRIDMAACLWVALWTVAAITLPRRFSITVVCLAIAAALGSTYYLFNASFNWFLCGVVVGTWHYPVMAVGSANLPALLAERYHLWNPNEVLFNLPFGAEYGVTMRTLLLTIYFTASAWCVVWASIHDRRRDPRVLFAICLPWMLFYCVPAQVHERYLLFFSACAGALIACGVRWLWMGLLISIAALVNTLHGALWASQMQPLPLSDPKHNVFTVMRYVIEGMYPHLAWMTLMIAVILLYAIAAPRRALDGGD